jgi:hypothetical protein
MNPALIVALGLALLINFSPRGECQQNPAQTQQRSANQLTVPSSQQHATRETATTHNDPPRWYKAPEWILVIVGGITAFVIGWQSWETRRSASAMERAVIATVRPQLKVPAIALIPGKLVEVDGVQTLQDDVNWRIECLIANAGGSNAHVGRK